MDAYVAVLLALKRFLAPPGYDPAAAAEAGAELTPKLTTVGLVCPPAAAITAAVSDRAVHFGNTLALEKPSI
jgi:hypothetical protein